MSIELILAVIAFAIIAIILFKIIGKIIKVLLILFAIVVIVLIATGFFVFKDVKDLGEKFGTADKLFLLHDDDRVLSGTIVGKIGSDNSSGSNEEDNFLKDVAPLNEGQLMSMQTLYRNKGYEEMLGSNYKMFVISIEAFDSLPDKVTLGEDEFERDFVISLLKADDPRQMYAEKMMEVKGMGKSDAAKQSIISQLGTKEEAKSKLFVFILASSIQGNGLGFLFNGFASKNIEVYPETPLFKVMRIFPSLSSKITEKLKNKEGN